MDNKVQDAAREFRRRFTLLRRDNGSRYWRHEPEDTEAGDLACYAHYFMPPDDDRYRFIGAALDILSDTNDEDEQRDRVDSDVNIYVGDLTRWLASHPTRAVYVDEGVAEQGWDDIYHALAVGQYLERWEVLERVRDWLLRS